MESRCSLLVCHEYYLLVGVRCSLRVACCALCDVRCMMCWLLH